MALKFTTPQQDNLVRNAGLGDSEALVAVITDLDAQLVTMDAQLRQVVGELADANEKLSLACAAAELPTTPL